MQLPIYAWIFLLIYAWINVTFYTDILKVFLPDMRYFAHGKDKQTVKIMAINVGLYYPQTIINISGHVWLNTWLCYIMNVWHCWHQGSVWEASMWLRSAVLLTDIFMWFLNALIDLWHFALFHIFIATDGLILIMRLWLKYYLIGAWWGICLSVYWVIFCPKFLWSLT